MTSLASTSDAGYALDSAWHAERERLDSLTSLYDPGTLELCERLGLRDGARCLEVGAGTGTLATALAQRIGPSGSVVAVDVNTRFLAPLAGERVEVWQADVTRDALPSAEFDLVHARLLLEHLPERNSVLRALADAVTPGGWLLIEDLDWSTALVIDPPSTVHETVANAIMRLFAAHGYDPYFGRRLPRALGALGLLEIGTRAESKQVRADPVRGLPQWELLADQLEPGLLASGLLSARDLERFHELWHDGETVYFAPLMVSCWGRRAA
jgi:ubiquinone/menaquinone biosynthesis C-methylase UbiE